MSESLSSTIDNDEDNNVNRLRAAEDKFYLQMCKFYVTLTVKEETKGSVEQKG